MQLSVHTAAERPESPVLHESLATVPAEQLQAKADSLVRHLRDDRVAQRACSYQEAGELLRDAHTYARRMQNNPWSRPSVVELYRAVHHRVLPVAERAQETFTAVVADVMTMSPYLDAQAKLEALHSCLSSPAWTQRRTSPDAYRLWLCEEMVKLSNHSSIAPSVHDEAFARLLDAQELDVTSRLSPEHDEQLYHGLSTNLLRHDVHNENTARIMRYILNNARFLKALKSEQQDVQAFVRSIGERALALIAGSHVSANTKARLSGKLLQLASGSDPKCLLPKERIVDEAVAAYRSPASEDYRDIELSYGFRNLWKSAGHATVDSAVRDRAIDKSIALLDDHACLFENRMDLAEGSGDFAQNRFSQPQREAHMYATARLLAEPGADRHDRFSQTFEQLVRNQVHASATMPQDDCDALMHALLRYREHSGLEDAVNLCDAASWAMRDEKLLPSPEVRSQLAQLKLDSLQDDIDGAEFGADDDSTGTFDEGEALAKEALTGKVILSDAQQEQLTRIMVQALEDCFVPGDQATYELGMRFQKIFDVSRQAAAEHDRIDYKSAMRSEPSGLDRKRETVPLAVLNRTAESAKRIRSFERHIRPLIYENRLPLSPEMHARVQEILGKDARRVALDAQQVAL